MLQTKEWTRSRRLKEGAGSAEELTNLREAVVLVGYLEERKRVGRVGEVKCCCCVDNGNVCHGPDHVIPVCHLFQILQ